MDATRPYDIAVGYGRRMKAHEQAIEAVVGDYRSSSGLAWRLTAVLLNRSVCIRFEHLGYPQFIRSLMVHGLAR